MYVRFVLGQAFLEGRHRAGILRDSRERRFWRTRCAARAKEVQKIFTWLNDHLPLPPIESFSEGRGLCWFKPEARACLERVRALAWVYRDHGAKVWEIENHHPGLITYEDKAQVVAIPRSALRL